MLAVKIERAIRRGTGDKVRSLRVDVLDNTILLSGRCATYYCKQLAQHATLEHLEGRSLSNKIEVW